MGDENEIVYDDETGTYVAVPARPYDVDIPNPVNDESPPMPDSVSPDYWGIPPNASFDPSNPSGAINAQNPNADPNRPFVQAGTTGGYLDGTGITVGQGRSITPAQQQAYIAAAIAAGVPEGWISGYLGRNPLDSNRLVEAYNSERAGQTAAGGAGGGAGGNGYNGPLAPPSTAAGWMPRYNAPVFTPPAPFSYKEFVAPTIEEARNEPGFRFALEQGSEALENSAAAKGTLRTGGTLKELIGFGQKLGDQNYNSVFNRAAGTYGMNYKNAYDTYGVNYQTLLDTHNELVEGTMNEYRPINQEAVINNSNAMQQWAIKAGLAKDIFEEGSD